MMSLVVKLGPEKSIIMLIYIDFWRNQLLRSVQKLLAALSSHKKYQTAWETHLHFQKCLRGFGKCNVCKNISRTSWWCVVHFHAPVGVRTNPSVNLFLQPATA